MQQAQENFVTALIFLVLGTILGPTLATAASAPQADPLLSEAKGPCDPKLDGPDYVPGTDVDGNPVVPANVSQAKVLVPNGILPPLGDQSSKGRTAQPKAYAELSQKDMDSILNPKPACPPERKAR